MNDIFRNYEKAAEALAAADDALTEALEAVNEAQRQCEERQRAGEIERQRRISELQTAVMNLPPAQLRQAEEELAECRKRVDGPSGSLWLRRMEEAEERVASLKELVEEHVATLEERELEKIKVEAFKLALSTENDDAEREAEEALRKYRAAEIARDSALNELRNYVVSEDDKSCSERVLLAQRSLEGFKRWRAQNEA